MPRILIVDDTQFMRLNIKKLIKPLGYDTIEAENGLEAVHQYEAYHPDLIIMDITMPDMDGLEALKLIKGINKDAKILMCSAMGQQMKVVEAINNGALDFIVKPFNNEKFIEKVIRCMNS